MSARDELSTSEDGHDGPCPAPPQPLALGGVLVRYGELALKGTNRQSFERALVRNLRFAVKPISAVRIERRGGRIWIEPESKTRAVARRARQVFGVKSVSPVAVLPAEAGLDELREASRAMFHEALAALPRPKGRALRFRVRTKRADKSFPLRSEEIDRHIGSALAQEHPELEVNLGQADLELEIDLRREARYVFVERLAGPGGLPVGSLGRALCLLSGGIDSPVAAWMAMKRGLEISYVHFHTQEYVGEASLKKVRDLVRCLAVWQPTSRLFVAPFGPLACRIRDGAPDRYRTVLMRRSMARVAQQLAHSMEFAALVSGDSLGQVASQTLENLACVDADSELPTLRPLIGFDKEETISTAREIGTLDISLRDTPDCCTVFQPKRPSLRTRAYDCRRIEAELELEPLEHACVQAMELWKAEDPSA